MHTRTMKKRRKSQSFLAFMTVLATLLTTPTSAFKECEGVTFAPVEMVVTRANDQEAVFGNKHSAEKKGLVDIHTFNHLYTYQVDRDINEKNEGVTIDLVKSWEKAATSEGFAFRLRAEFNSAEASRAGMGFHVQLGYKIKQGNGYVIETVAEASSLASDASPTSTIAIDVPNLPAGRDYQLRYLFGQKEVLHNGSQSLGMQEDTISTGDELISCNLPFFTQELVLIDRKALSHRVHQYMRTHDDQEKDIAKHPICDFNMLDGEKHHEERGLQCNSHYFSYPIGDQGKNHEFAMDHGVDKDGFELKTIAQYPFSVSGTDGEPITQLFKMTIGAEFAVAGGLRAILRRADGSVLSEFENLHPFYCLLDQSCQFAWRQQKNHQSFQVVLTTGTYILQIVDLSAESYNQWLIDELKLTRIPFSVYIESYPILQNEIRENCPFMNMMEDWIQVKYIDNQSGQKFHFSDKIIMNLVDLKSEFRIVPEDDSILKIVIREAFGVNTQIGLCHPTSEGTPDCFAFGKQIGTTEILYYENLLQDVEYTVVFDYSHSILAFHKFDVCPHLPVEISMISTGERTIINESRNEGLGLTDKASKKKLKDIFKRMNQGGKLTIDDPLNEGSFMLSSHSEAEHEVLYSQDIEVGIKMGLYMEIFYSPYDDEVMELFIADRYGQLKLQADTSDEYDNGDTGNLAVFEQNKYKSSKMIWVDLEAGEYTIQIVNLRQPKAKQTSFYENINFQLYIRYDFVNTPREAFLPGNLNYHGLVGVGDETHDFGHVTMYWDDMTLWHKKISTIFTVQSAMASVSIQLEQKGEQVQIKLTKFNAEKDTWDIPEFSSLYPTSNEDSHIWTIEAFDLEAHAIYKLKIFKTSYGEHDQIENVEMGERYDINFSLKIDLSENDDASIAANQYKINEDFLPNDIDLIAKSKPSLMGLKEKSFTMGNRNMIHLIEYGDGYKEMKLIPAYVPKNQNIFYAKQSDEQIILSLEFTVSGIGEVLYAGLYEYTQGVNQMSIHIFDAETHESVVISKQGKHYSHIPSAYLDEGTYYFVIKNDRASNIGKHSQAPMQFQLDIVRHRIPAEAEQYLVHQLEAIQLCQLPMMPQNGLSKPGYLHALSGQQMQEILYIGVMELDSGSHTSFTIEERSLVTVYIETDADTPVAISIEETGGMRKSVGLSDDQDSSQSNFLKQEGFKQRNVVQLREFLGKGVYWISAKAINEDILLNFDDRDSFCETFKMVLTVTPTASAIFPFVEDVEEQHCEEVDPLVNQLRLNGMVKSNLTREMTHYGAEVGYFDFDSRDEEGPFMVYFQLDYDVSQEGVIALVVSEYDKDYSIFQEVDLYEINDSQTVLYTILNKGTYAISIQSIVSTPQKFGQIGISQHKLQSKPLIRSHCFRGTYTYMISSVNERDQYNTGGPIDKQARVRIMETLDDMRDLRKHVACHSDTVPMTFPVSDEGFERQYTFKMSHGGRAMINLIVEEEPNYIRIVFNERNSDNQVKVFLQKSGKDEQPITSSTSDRQLSTVLKASKKPYNIVIVYHHIDEDDPCPLLDFHVAVKPVSQLATENLRCFGYKLPPVEVNVDKKTTKVEARSAFSSDWILENGKTSDSNASEYDIMIDLPHSDYMIDTELKTDFLSNRMHMKLFGLDEQSGEWHALAASHWFNENSYEDLAIDSEQMMSTKIGDLSMVQKLRYIEDVPVQVAKNASQLMLRLKLNGEPVLKMLEAMGHLDLQAQTYCFNFHLSIFIDEIGSSHFEDDANNKLIRIDWIGTEQNVESYDTSKRLTGILQFEKSISHHLPKLKSSFQDTIYLVPLDQKHKRDKHHETVKASHMKLKVDNDNTLLISFAPFTLVKGMCYKLSFDTSGEGFMPDFTGKKSMAGPQNPLAAMIPHDLDDMQDLIVCSSNCNCDTIGTAECIDTGFAGSACVCHPNFTGEDCSECVNGFYRNSDGFCMKATICSENGGYEDCNGWGQCVQTGSTAVCTCDHGFANDGLDQCGRCSDPIMKWPQECHRSRNWVTEQEEYECSSLMHEMPRKLFKDPKKDDKTSLKQIIYQGKSGVLNWVGRYALIRSSLQDKNSVVGRFWRKDNSAGLNKEFIHTTSHQFFVAQPSVFRLHLNTLDSGVMVQYQIYDGNMEFVHGSSSDDFDQEGFGQLTPGNPHAVYEKPFTLKLEFRRFDPHDSMVAAADCPKIELHFSVTPVNFHVDAITCSPEQLAHSKNQDFQTKHVFGHETEIIEYEHVILPSTWLKEPKNHPENILKFGEEHEVRFGLIEIELEVTVAGTFSALVASNFGEMYPYMELFEKKDYPHKYYKAEKHNVLDNVELSDDHWARDSDEGVAHNNLVWDHLTSVELNYLPKGEYVLLVEIPQAFWFHIKGTATCLDMNFMMEFMPKDASTTEDSMFMSDDEAVQVMHVFPSSGHSMNLAMELNLQMQLDMHVDFREMAERTADLAHLCQLQNQANTKKFFAPTRFQYLGDKVHLMFDFSHNADIFKNVLREVPENKKDKALCWQLTCKSTPITEGGPYLTFSNQQYTYCFSNELINDSVSEDESLMCNPLAQAKHHDDGSCLCTPPYTGPYCEQCINGFDSSEEKVHSRNGYKKHTLCSPKTDGDDYMCNNFGKYIPSKDTCVCNTGYTGDYCQFCSNMMFEYPDCTGAYEASLMDSSAFNGFTQRRAETLYHKDYHRNDAASNPFQQQCSYSDFPNHLNRLENYDQFMGDFHIADVFTANHDADNVIKFTPQDEGFFKIMVKQPEREAAFTSADDALHLEIGVVRADGSGEMHTSGNHEMKILNGNLQLDFTILEFEIGPSIVKHPLHIYFRSANRHGDFEENTQCMQLYIEMEFRVTSSIHQCQSNNPYLTSSKEAIDIGRGTTWPKNEQISTLQIADNAQDVPFFYSQDFFVKHDETMGEFDVEIQLAQKFVDQHLIIPVVEVIQMGHKTADAGHHPVYSRPECKYGCNVAGHKLLNAFTIETTIPSGTLFRVWLYQHPAVVSLKLRKKMKQETCINFSLQLRTVAPTSKEHQDSLKDSITCEHTRYLPKSLNRLRYLGQVGSAQQDFDYIEFYRVDNLQYDGRTTSFHLQETTVIRIDIVEHENLQFFLTIFNEYMVEVVSQEAQEIKGTGVYLIPSIFAVLEAGEYNMQIEFVAQQSEILRQPCQAIQLQIAMNRADKNYLFPRVKPSGGHIDQISLETATNVKGKFFEAKVENVDEKFGKFNVLWQGIFMFEDRNDLNLAMKVTSDFMRADVNFLMTNVETGQHFMPQHIFEDSKKMSMPQIDTGYYRIIVFMQNVEQIGVKIPVQFAPVIYSFGFRLFSFEQRSTSYIQEVTVSGEDYDKIAIINRVDFTLAFSSEPKMECYSRGRMLPDDLTQDVLQQETDFSFTFTIFGQDMAFINEKVITYQPEEGEDILRIQIDEGIHIKLYKKSDFVNDRENASPIALSHDRLGNNVHEMVAEDLHHTEVYSIHVIYASDSDDFEEKAALACLVATMQVKISNSNTDFVCLKERLNSLKAQHDAQTYPFTLSYNSSPEKGKHMLMSAKKSTGEVEAASYEIQIKDDNTDLEVTIEGSDHLYGARIKIAENTHDFDSKQDDPAGRGMHTLLGHIWGGKNTLEADSIGSPKHMTKYMFRNVPVGTYSVHLEQPEKPKKCNNVVDVLFQVSQSIESRLHEQFSEGKSKQTRFQSKLENDQNGSFKLPSTLPLALDSYRFLGGGSTEDKYVLFTDNYVLNDEESLNYFSIGPMTNNRMFVRAYVEDNSIGFNLTCTGAKDPKRHASPSDVGALIQADLPEGGMCKLSLFHNSKNTLNRKVFLEEKVRITITVADWKFIKQEYAQRHEEGLSECRSSQWPLALAKDTKMATSSDEQSYYNYPLVRYPVGGRASGSAIDMNTYYFRFNETQRFYFEVGSNFHNSHAVLALKPTQKSFGMYEIYGKQIGNVNVIDTEVRPGDYALVILAYTSAEEPCGMYSLKGVLNMHSAMASHDSQSSKFYHGSTVCEIRNSEEAPSQIYESEAKTRKGNEAVIDPEGNFFRYYPDLLIVKEHTDVVEPWTHEIILEVPHTSFLQVTVAGDGINQMIVKVYKKQTGKLVEKVLHSKSKTAMEISEKKFTWKLETNSAYMIEIEYAGDMMNRMQEEELCLYFDMTISINSLKSLGEKLSCSANEQIQTAPSLLTALPQEIKDRDLNFHMNGLYKLKYPEDFMALKYFKTGKSTQSMVLPAVLDIKDPFSFEAELAFDVHMADFNIELVLFDADSAARATDDDPADYAIYAQQTPLLNLEDNDDETFFRQIPRMHIKPHDELGSGLKYMLSIEEKQAFYLFNEVSKSEGVQQLCLPFIFKMKIEKEDSQHGWGLSKFLQLAADHVSGTNNNELFDKPHIVDYKIVSHSHDHAMAQHISVPFNVEHIMATVLMTHMPVDNDQLRHSGIALAFKIDGETRVRYNPTNIDLEPIEVNEETTMYLLKCDFVFNLGSFRSELQGADDMELQLEVNELSFVTITTDEIMTIHSFTQAKFEHAVIAVEFPEDIEAKELAAKRHKGKVIHDSLQRVIDEMGDFEKRGTRYPKEVKDSIAKMFVEQDWESASDGDKAKLLKTIEAVKHINTVKPLTVYEGDDFVAPKCACVNGECLDGESQCHKCYAGWKGRMCDMPDKGNKAVHKPDDTRMHAAKISDDLEEDEIFHAERKKKGYDGDKLQSSHGRRFNDKKSKDHFTPHQKYNGADVVPPTTTSDKSKTSDTGGAKQIHDDDGDSVKPKTPKKSSGTVGKSHVTTASDVDAEEDTIQPKISTYKKPPQETIIAQTNSSHPKHPQDSPPGLISSIFWSFVGLVKWIMIIAVGIVCLVLLKSGCEKIQESVKSATAKKKKGRKKRQAELNDDGMGLSENEAGIQFSDGEDEAGNDDSDEDNSPIEMTLVHRKQKDEQAAAGRKRRTKRQPSDDQEGGGLLLFTQDEEKGSIDSSQQPENDEKYNPFDDFSQQQQQQEGDLIGLAEDYPADVVGHAMVNEIDVALEEDNVGSDDDEFAGFV